MAEEHSNKRRPLTLGSESCSSSKKSKAPPASPSCPVSGSASVTVKQEPEERDIAHGGRASRAIPAVAEQVNPLAEEEVEPPRVNGSFELQLLHCAVAAECFRPLKPPLFKCEAGHLLCGSCRGGGGEGYCRMCGRDTAFVHCGPELDKYVGGFKVPCPFEAYGCDSVVVYHELAAHRAACAYTPCHCAVAGCTFTASPPMLRDHLAAEHSWRVVALPGYGMAIPLIVPTAASGSPEQHRLLVVKGDKRRLFVLCVRAVGSTAYWAVSVACVRASGAAEAGPQYVCILWAEAPLAPGPGMPARKSHHQMTEAVVASCAAPGGPAVDGCGEMVVPPAMLVGPSRAIRLRVRITEVAPAPAPQLPAPN